jgi:hypothetical protein
VKTRPGSKHAQVQCWGKVEHQCILRRDTAAARLDATRYESGLVYRYSFTYDAEGSTTASMLALSRSGHGPIQRKSFIICQVNHVCSKLSHATCSVPLQAVAPVQVNNRRCVDCHLELFLGVDAYCVGIRLWQRLP